ncbi:Mechanosensitive ion channel protein 10 [Hibiscus syriacus]|uniref:Mechanosensitive ion channel protein 10 n=1 Tax=Hibiscus syriacus TaxID=106335 RepID=A0A6A2Y1M3_HIBSY|nr:Mechanosensitive ion channel protein 10 [Hibiscus syriacus]
MAEKRSSGGGGEVVINVHSEENPEVLKGSAPIEIEALDPQQNAHVSPTKFGPTLDKVSIEKGKWRNKKLKGVVIEWFIFLLLLGCLIACLTVDNLQNIHFWGLKTWKWCVLVIVIFSGMLITRWFVRLVVFLIEINFLLGKKVLYFAYGLKKSVQVFIWLSSILVTWVLFFLDVKRSKTTTKIVDNVTWVLVSVVIGAFLWLLKTLLFMMLASNFHKKKFFDRIQESVFYQYIIQTLSGPPLMELAEETTAHLTVRNAKMGKGHKTKKLIDMGKVHRLKREKVSSWHMKVWLMLSPIQGFPQSPTPLTKILTRKAVN